MSWRAPGRGRAAARAITIHALELLSCAPPDFTLRVHCSKGTYVRTLCHDLGAALGTGGCHGCAAAHGGRSLYGGAGRAAGGHSGPPCAGVPAAAGRHAVCGPSCTDADAAQEKCCRNGASFTLRFAPGRYRLYAESGEFLALGEVRDGRMETREELFCNLRGCI